VVFLTLIGYEAARTDGLLEAFSSMKSNFNFMVDVVSEVRSIAMF
jgi:hypothetical protein